MVDEKTSVPREQPSLSDPFLLHRVNAHEESSSDLSESAPMLSDCESMTFDNGQTSRKLGLRSPVFWSLLTTATYTLLSIITLIALFRVHRTTDHRGVGHGSTRVNGREFCGTERETALAAGCKFDVLGFAWVPPMCWDESATQSSSQKLRQLAGLTELDLDNFILYFDKNRTQLATIRDFEIGGLGNAGRYPVKTPFYTEPVYHKAHCLHVWELQHSALFKASEGQNDVWVWERARQWEHSLHCNRVIYHDEWDIPGQGALALYPGTGDCILIRE
ncbi:hypothetical protein BP5796_12627 [Coleophoma crateriformis]|uniref:Uncharacterized protein n=1 Tax=Coleophoma crateriformis TaxID=565419 RepID=A0A3D8Q7L3_9HELO|nr:hypothetical protein BP5796_12627 [Coleophoma crateriformis]